MRIEITDEIPDFQKGCCLGCLAYGALCVLGVLTMALFGDRMDDRWLTIRNGSRRNLYVSGYWPYDDPMPRERLPARGVRRLQPFAGDFDRGKGHDLALFASEKQAKPVLILLLSEDALAQLDARDVRIEVEDQGASIRSLVKPVSSLSRD